MNSSTPNKANAPVNFRARFLKHALAAVALAAVALSGNTAYGANSTWTGGSVSTDWATGANWGGTAPAAGNGLIFGAAGTSGTSLTDTLTSGTFNIGGITFNSGASSYSMSGNAFVLHNGAVITNNSTANQSFSNNIVVDNTLSGVVLGAVGAGSVTLSGNITTNYATAATALQTTGGVLVAGTNIDAMNAFSGAGMILSGSNNLANGSFVGQINAGSSTVAGSLILASANSAGTSTSQVASISLGKQSVLTFAGSSAIANSGIAITQSAINGNWDAIVLDTNSSGAGVNQTVGSITMGAQDGIELFQGHDVTSGSPNLIVTGTTQFGNPASAKATNIVASGGANFVLNNLTAAAGTAAVTTTLYLDGNSTGNKVAGVIANNTGTALDTAAISKGGLGTWSFSGANTYTGSTTVGGGILNLDFSVASGALFTGSTASPTSNIINSGNAVNLSGGELELTGGSGAANTQTLGGITLGGGGSSGTNLAGASMIYLNTNGASSLGLTIASITRTNLGTTLNFVLNSGSTLTDSGGTASTFLGQYAFYNGNDYAELNGSKQVISATTAANFANGNASITSATTGAAGSYFLLNGSVSRGASAAFAFKGLKIADTGSAQSLNLGTNGLTASNSSILYTGGNTGQYLITGGTIAGAAATDLVVNVASGATLTIDSGGNYSGATAALTKTGAGTLVSNGAKTYAGQTYIDQGILSTDTIAVGGTSSGIGAAAATAGNLYINGGTLKYTGSATATTDRIISIGPDGATLDASGSGSVTFSGTPVFPLLNVTQSLTLTGTSTLANTFSGVLANGNSTGSQPDGLLTVTKTGAGTWVLSGANTFTGGLVINQGILQVTPAVADTASAASLGVVGAITFTGGTLQYGNANAADYSYRIENSTSAISVDTNGQAITYASALNSNNTGGLTKAGAGTLTLAGANAYTGATSVTGGTLTVSGSTVAGSAVSVANTGTLNVTGTVGGTVNLASGATLSGVGGNIGALTVTGGSIINIGGGTTTGTLHGSTLTFSAGTGNGVLSIDVGASGASDLLSLSGAASLASNMFTVNVNSLTGATTGTAYTFISATGGLTLADFTGGTLTGTLAGDTLSFGGGGTSVTVTINAPSAPASAYFTGGTSGDLTVLTNFANSATGGSISIAPDSTSDVYFTANTGTAGTSALTPNTNTAAVSYKGITFTGSGTPATSGVTVSGSNSVTIATDGITVQSGSGANTISAPVVLGATQTWTNLSSNLFTVSGGVTGTGNLAIQNNSTGGTTISGGTINHVGSITNSGSGTGTTTISSAIGSNVTSVTQNSSGSNLVLSNATGNSYTGPTTVSAGKLLVSNTSGSATGTGALTVSNGATVGGAGIINASSFTINGNVQVGNGTDSTSTTTITGASASTFGSTSSLTYNLNANGTSTNALLTGNTAVTFNALKLTFNLTIPGVLQTTTPLVLITATSGSDFTFGGALTTGTNALSQTEIYGANLTFAGDPANWYGNSYLIVSGNSIELEVVPEPSTWAMMLGGLVLLVLIQRRRSKLS